MQHTLCLENQFSLPQGTFPNKIETTTMFASYALVLVPSNRNMFDVCLQGRRASTFVRKALKTVIHLLQKTGPRPVVQVMEFDKESSQAGFEKLKSRRTKGKFVFQVVSQPQHHRGALWFLRRRQNHSFTCIHSIQIHNQKKGRKKVVMIYMNHGWGIN